MCVQQILYAHMMSTCVFFCDASCYFLCSTAVLANQRDIIFLLDGSANVGNTNFPFVRDFLVNLVRLLQVGIDDVRIGVVQFSENPKTEFFLNTFLTKSDVLSRLSQLRLQGGSVLNFGSALDFVLSDHFTEAGGSRIDENVPQVLVFLAAGPSSDSFRQAANSLARAGVLTFCIGVRNAVRADLQQIAFNPQMVYFKDDFSSLAALPQDMIRPLTTYIRERKKDILFLTDGSANLAGQFPAVRDFVVRVISDLDVKPDGVRVAVAQFSDNVQVEFNFEEIPSKADILQKVKRMRIKSGRQLNIGAALEYAQRNIFVRGAGSRIDEGVPQFLVLLAAGRSSDNVEQGANALKRANVVPFVIRARTAYPAELEKIVFDPQFLISADSLSRIVEVHPKIVNLLKTTQLAPAEVQKKDVVFLIEGSDGIRSSFPALKTFIENVVQSMKVGLDDIRVAVVQYSNVPKAEFLLNAHPDQNSVISAVRRLSPMGGSPVNTGAALNFVLRNVFVSQGGSRDDEGVPLFLILVTAEKSRDDVERPSISLKGRGAIPFAIGFGNADISELQTISFVPELSLFIPDVRQLSNLQEVISKRVILLSREEIETMEPILLPPTTVDRKRDVVFLVDGSQSAVPDFLSVREFIERLVTSLNVDADATRVAVVQFSDDARADFLLNTYSTKDEVQVAVRRLRPKGGRQLNIGSALEFVSKNIFTRPSGSRIEEGVPQFLILLISRQSDDEVEDPALEVKQVGVAPLVVGKNVDIQELVQIGLSPEYVFQVSTYQDLSSLTQNLLTPVTTLTTQEIRRLIGEIRPPPDIGTDAKDVVFLIDSSTGVGSDNTARIRDFITRFVERLDVGERQVRVALVQFSNNVFPEFYLKDCRAKSDLLNALRRLRYRGGAPLNVGKALDYVVKNIFVKPAGSRREDGVPQHLFLILGGRSQDDISRPASALQASGIKSLGIGAGKADSAELERITREGSAVFFVPQFTELQGIENRIFALFQQLPEPPLEPEILPVGQSFFSKVMLRF
uniref:Uncharacterized protein n=1 Tax=Sphaerodactylus townsendi TaxID=933632 RepID=A0ACB8GEQ8_9SAUR